MKRRDFLTLFGAVPAATVGWAPLVRGDDKRTTGLEKLAKLYRRPCSPFKHEQLIADAVRAAETEFASVGATDGFIYVYAGRNEEATPPYSWCRCETFIEASRVTGSTDHLHRRVNGLLPHTWL